MWATALTSDESALEVCIHDDALYSSTFFTFTFAIAVTSPVKQVVYCNDIQGTLQAGASVVPVPDS